MQYRAFGNTGMQVSVVGFGGWAIGGNGFGPVDRAEALRALARAEELGCNFVDTAAVYGDSESILGRFLVGRRSRWHVATKYSGQAEGLTALAERQLRQLATDRIDFYQIHWVPRGKDESLYEELHRLKQSGKVRAVGVSLYTTEDIDFVLDRNLVDGIQLRFSLLDPYPLLSRLTALRVAGTGIIVRSALKNGFLAGKFSAATIFSDPNDQRHRLSSEEIARTAKAADRFRFLETHVGSMVLAAARYPLSFPEVSTVLMSTKSVLQAETNFGKVPGDYFDPEALARISAVQRELGLSAPGIANRIMARVKQLLRSIR